MKPISASTCRAARLPLLSFMALFSVICSAVAMAQLGPPPSTNASRNWWNLSYLRTEAGTGKDHGADLNVDGLASVGIERPTVTVCFSASRDQVAEVTRLLKELDLSWPPKPVAQRKPVPDTPTEMLILTHGDHQYDMAGDYKPEAVKKRLYDIITSVLADGEKRIAEMKSGKPPVSGLLSCPAAVTP